MGRGKQRGGADPGRGHLAEFCFPQRQRHRRLQHREPSARREDRVQGEPELVAQARAQSKEIIFTPIGSDATRVAALLSGEVDIIEPVPIQDISRVDSSPNALVMKGPELRTIFSAWTSPATNCCSPNVKGKNPFKDVRVREAFFKAIDIELIKNRVMRGPSTPSALMIAPEPFPLSKDFTRPKFDPDGAKKLLTEAGYPDGFEVTMDCPNDRYVNDSAICQAVVGMLAVSASRSTCWRSPRCNTLPRC